jgi:phage tail sheath protein FI
MAEKILSPGVFQNESDQSLVQQGIQGTSTAVVGPTVLGQPFVPTYVTSYTEFVSKFGETFKSSSYYYEYFTSQVAKDFFQNGGQTLLVTRIVNGSGSTAMSTYASSSVGAILNSNSSSFVLETLAWGDVMNNTSSLSGGALANGSAINVRWEVTQVSTGSGTFTLAIRAGNDNTATPNYLETWSNLSLDPNQPNFISRVIGDTKPVFRIDTAGTPYIDYTGSYANASQYVRVKSVTYPIADSIDNNGNFKSGSLNPISGAPNSGSLPVLGSGSATSTLNNAGGSFAGGLPATTLGSNFNELIGDGSTNNNNIQGFTNPDYITAFSILTNKDDYRFNVLLAPGIAANGAAADDMISVCQNRGDAIALLDCTLYGQTVSAASTAASSQNSNYAATYWPWVQLYNSNLGKNIWCPPSTVMGGVLAFNDQVGAEWFAPAGLNRGGVPSVLKAERKLSQNDRDTLYDANVNPLATFPGNGVVVFGQKTLQKKSTALDRVNVRRLLIALKDYIGQVANNLVFEQNTNVTRNLFLSQVNPYLDSVVQRQGLYAYKVVMDESNNTPDVIDRNQLVGQIYIQPTKTAEFIILNFNVQPTGATFPA